MEAVCTTLEQSPRERQPLPVLTHIGKAVYRPDGGPCPGMARAASARAWRKAELRPPLRPGRRAAGTLLGPPGPGVALCPGDRERAAPLAHTQLRGRQAAVRATRVDLTQTGTGAPSTSSCSHASLGLARAALPAGVGTGESPGSGCSACRAACGLGAAFSMCRPRDAESRERGRVDQTQTPGQAREAGHAHVAFCHRASEFVQCQK